MTTATMTSTSTDHITPLTNQHGGEIQKFGTVIQHLSIGLNADVRQKIVEKLNLLLADTMTLRDLYKKSHWQVSGPTFYSLHLLFDKHYGEQAELVDTIAERIQTLGGVSVAMAHDVAELSRLKRPPRGRQEVPVQIAGLLEGHEQILLAARALAHEAADKGDDGTNDMLAGDVVRTNEMQAWFIGEHLVNMPLVHAGK